MVLKSRAPELVNHLAIIWCYNRATHQTGYKAIQSKEVFAHMVLKSRAPQLVTNQAILHIWCLEQGTTAGYQSSNFAHMVLKSRAPQLVTNQAILHIWC
jgi:hypothetical protein